MTRVVTKILHDDEPDSPLGKGLESRFFISATELRAAQNPVQCVTWWWEIHRDQLINEALKIADPRHSAVSPSGRSTRQQT